LIKIPVENENIEQIVNLSLPKFSYDYELKKDDDVNLFRTLIENIGIKKVFKKAKYYGDKNAAEFDNIADIKNIILKNPLITGIYISKAIHKTHIELTENGTKAAQVTYFGMSFEGCMPIFRKQEYIDIKFNKPFVYLIREKKTNEILFFGVLYEPDLWK
jgi:serpin B